MTTEAPTQAQLAQQMSELLARFQTFTKQQKDWLAGTPTGGPEGDGRYPFTDYVGVTYLVPCPALDSARVEGNVDSAKGYAAQASSSMMSAKAYLTQSSLARDVANGFAQAALAARDLSQIYADQAGTHAANARSYAADAAASAEVAKRDLKALADSVAAAGEYADAAAASADASENARAASASLMAAASSSASAAAASAATAATFNPANFAPVSGVAGAFSVGGTLSVSGNQAWHAGNFNPTGVKTVYSGNYGTQAFMHTYAWNNSTTRWSTVFEPNASLNFYSYDINGGTPSSVLQLANKASGQTTSWFNTAVRFVGWGGDVNRGLIYFGAGEQYIYGRGSDIEFCSSGRYAVLNSGGTILTTSNFNTSALGWNGASPVNNDWNNASSTGWFMADNAYNAPGAGWFMGSVHVHNNDWIQQEAWAFTEFPTRRYRRSKLGGGWTAWQRHGDVIVSSTDPGGPDGNIWVQT